MRRQVSLLPRTPAIRQRRNCAAIVSTTANGILAAITLLMLPTAAIARAGDVAIGLEDGTLIVMDSNGRVQCEHYESCEHRATLGRLRQPGCHIASSQLAADGGAPVFASHHSTLRTATDEIAVGVGCVTALQYSPDARCGLCSHPCSWLLFYTTSLLAVCHPSPPPFT